jgi:hypothetical protein
MEIITPFDLGDVVRINELEVKGRIVGVYIYNDGVEFKTRYFIDGKLQIEYFIASELSK